MAKKLQVIGSFLDEAAVNRLIQKYLAENPPADGVSPSISVSEIEGGYRLTIKDANGEQTVDISEGTPFETDETLILKDGVLRVNTTNEAEQDNTLPITSAGVHTQLGNIEVLLKTI